MSSANEATLADACTAWQGGQNIGSSPLRAGGRVLTGVPHYFSADYIDEYDRAAEGNEEVLQRSRTLLEAVWASPLRTVEEWRSHLGIDGAGAAARGINSKPVEDHQIEQLIERPRATIIMPLWGFSLSESVAAGFGSRFMFRLHGAFPGVPVWAHSGIKPDELEVVGSGVYRVLDCPMEGATRVVNLQFESHVRLIEVSQH